jgi:excisionase family DNA binding protein
VAIASELLTVAEVAERLRVHPRTAKKWYRAGRFPCVKVSPKVVRFDWEAVVAALKRRGAKKARPCGEA